MVEKCIVPQCIIIQQRFKIVDARLTKTRGIGETIIDMHETVEHCSRMHEQDLSLIAEIESLPPTTTTKVPERVLEAFKAYVESGRRDTTVTLLQSVMGAVIKLLVHLDASYYAAVRENDVSYVQSCEKFVRSLEQICWRELDDCENKAAITVLHTLLVRWPQSMPVHDERKEQTLLHIVKRICFDGEQVKCLMKLLRQSTYDTEAELFLQLLQQCTSPQMMRKHLQKEGWSIRACIDKCTAAHISHTELDVIMRMTMLAAHYPPSSSLCVLRTDAEHTLVLWERQLHCNDDAQVHAAIIVLIRLLSLHSTVCTSCSTNNTQMPSWALEEEMQQRILQLCLTTAARFAPLMQHGTPEGIILAKGEPESSECADDDTVWLEAQAGLMRAFRAYDSLCNVATDYGVYCASAIRQQFATMLLNMQTVCMHRGAFEAAYTAFVQFVVTPTKIRNAPPTLSVDYILDCWSALMQVLESVDEHTTVESINEQLQCRIVRTRRSAGFPQAIVSTLVAFMCSVSDERAAELISATIDRLRYLLLSESAEITVSKRNASVHTLVHILREKRLSTREHAEGIMCTCLCASTLVDTQAAEFESTKYALSVLFVQAHRRLFGAGACHVPMQRDPYDVMNAQFDVQDAAEDNVASGGAVCTLRVAGVSAIEKKLNRLYSLVMALLKHWQSGLKRGSNTAPLSITMCLTIVMYSWRSLTVHDSQRVNAMRSIVAYALPRMSNIAVRVMCVRVLSALTRDCELDKLLQYSSACVSNAREADAMLLLLNEVKRRMQRSRGRQTRSENIPKIVIEALPILLRKRVETYLAQ